MNGTLHYDLFISHIPCSYKVFAIVLPADLACPAAVHRVTTATACLGLGAQLLCAQLIDAPRCWGPRERPPSLPPGLKGSGKTCQKVRRDELVSRGSSFLFGTECKRPFGKSAGEQNSLWQLSCSFEL